MRGSRDVRGCGFAAYASSVLHEELQDALGVALVAHYRRSGERLAPAAWLNTLRTNSTLAEQRTRSILELYYRRTGVASLDGLAVLDSGCGFGALSIMLAASGATVVGIDPNQERLEVGREIAQQHGLPARFEPGSMTHLSLEDDEVDLVVMNNSLCYVVDEESRVQALGEAYRVLRPRGHVLVRNPNRMTPIDPFSRLPFVAMLAPRAADRVAGAAGRARSHVRLRSNRAARREFERACFTAVSVHPSSESGRLARAVPRLARYQHLIAEKPRG
jgi:ubiquinone/menaquinone biosynthesis C-methylase UbiE